jgi:hypothetical protein
MRSLFLTAAAVVFCAASAGALTIAPLPFSDLVAASNLVVYGRVADVRGQWTDDRQGIDSLVTLDVLDRFKGPGRSTVTFRIPGGRAGNTVNVRPGVPSFREGDLVVLFLASRGPALPAPVGLSQGVLRVSADPRSGELMVARPLGFGGETGVGARGGASRAPIRLASLAEGVRARAEAAR